MSESVKKRVSPSGYERVSHALWFVANGQTLKGPYSSEELLRQINESHLEEGSYCWKQGYGEWRPICSIAEFGLTAKPYVVQPYPKVALPSAAPRKLRSSRRHLRSYSDIKKPWLDQEEERKTVKVQLQRQNSWAVGHKERAFMAIFCVLIAWLAVSVALNQVEQQFTLLMQKQKVGQWVKVDEAHMISEKPWQMSWLNPVFSAPGIQGTLEKKSWPVRVQTKRLVQNAEEGSIPWTYKDYSMQWSSAKGFGGYRFSGKADPIYSQPVEIHLEWQASEPHSLKGRTPGYPGL